jgi:D-glycero-D-manno-heptose 1,7-bisphosphate phosphatase
MTGTSMKLIILDRDGVINEDSDAFIKSPEEWHAIPGSLDAIERLNQAGYTVVVATNQSGIARQLFSMSTLNDIHKKMHAAVENVGGIIDAVFFCPHVEEDYCDCRKPKPGMLNEIARRYEVNLKDAPCVGDSLRDLQAGFSVGCVPHLVLTGKGKKTVEKSGLPPGTMVHANLAAMVDVLLQQAKQSKQSPQTQE